MIFRRAIVSEISNNAGAVFSVLFFIVFTQVLVHLLGDASNGKVDPKDLVSIVALETLTNIPLILVLTVFIAVLIALSRAFRDSEMVVWFAAGQSLFTWVRPVLRFTLPVAAVIAMLAFFVSPWAERLIAEARTRFQHRDDVSKVTPGQFIESAGSNRVFFVENLDPEGGRVQSVFAAQRRGDRESVIVASSGVMETHADGARFLVLRNGRRYEGDAGVPKYRVLEFDRYAIRLDAQPEAPLTNAQTRTIPTRLLLTDFTPRNQGELLSRIALPVVGVVLALLAIPLAYVNPRMGRSFNFFAAMFLYMLYSNCLNIVQSLIAQGRLDFWAGLVLPHLIALLVVVVLFRHQLSVAGLFARLPRRAAARAA